MLPALHNAPRLPNGLPQIIHQIWLGGEMPARFDEHRASWQKLHPGWHYQLWTDESLPALLPHLQSREAFDRPNGDMLAVRASLLRYELLRLFGGVYADVDLMLYRPFAHLLPAGDRLWYVDWRPHIPSNLCMLATPGHAGFDGIIHRVLQARRKHGPVTSNRDHKQAAGDGAWCAHVRESGIWAGEELVRHNGQRIGAAWSTGWGHLCYNTFLALGHCCPGDTDTWAELVLGSQRSFGVHEVACTWFDRY